LPPPFAIRWQTTWIDWQSPFSVAGLRLAETAMPRRMLPSGPFSVIGSDGEAQHLGQATLVAQATIERSIA
jgi:hypothetical protein